MTVETVFHDISMFIKERTSLVRVALDTGFLNAVLKQTPVSKPSMRGMAVNTEYPPFLEGMMAWQGKLRLGRFMAGKTELARGKRSDF